MVSIRSARTSNHSNHHHLLAWPGLITLCGEAWETCDPDGWTTVDCDGWTIVGSNDWISPDPELDDGCRIVSGDGGTTAGCTG
jgi:hypothetical protein